MIKVSIIGNGNVSYHLVQAISKAEGVRTLKVIDSRMDMLEETGTSPKPTLGAQKTEYPDIYIIAVSDDAIASVSRKIRKTKSLVVHTSGSVPMNTLPKDVRKGVFYPLQTFSKGAKLDFSKIPICIEAENKDDLELLRKLAHCLSDVVHVIPSEKRSYLHLSAVFANNFTNYMYRLAEETCMKQDLPFSMLLPLIRETANKMERLSPVEAQTGPAKRGDLATMEKHFELMNTKEHKEVYSLLSQSIQQTYGEKP